MPHTRFQCSTQKRMVFREYRRHPGVSLMSMLLNNRISFSYGRCILSLLLLAAAPVHAQLKTTVHVDPAKTGPVVYTTSLGIAADRWDAKAFDPATVQLLKDAGITSLRFPGNNGIAELYHWSTGAITNPYTND